MGKRGQVISKLGAEIKSQFTIPRWMMAKPDSSGERKLKIYIDRN
jgi:hypothetical protein